MAKDKEIKGCYTLNLPLKTETWQEHILDKKLETARQIYNATLSHLKKRHRAMKCDKDWKVALNMEKGAERTKLFRELDKRYGLREGDMWVFIKETYKYLQYLSADEALTIAKRAFSAFEEEKYQKSTTKTNKRIVSRFHKYGDFDSIQGKTVFAGMMLKVREDDSYYITWKKKSVRGTDCVGKNAKKKGRKKTNKDLIIDVKIEDRDYYAKEALQSFKEDLRLNRKDTNRKTRYCSLLRKKVNGKNRYYVQIVIEGIPPQKYNKDGTFRRSLGKGKVGIDIGTSSVAYATDTKVGIVNLNPNKDKRTEHMAIERRLNRKLDRQRRANNPNKYNEDGTIKQGNKDKWIKSKSQLDTERKLSELKRKNAEQRKQHHNKLVNELLKLGGEFHIESMNFKALAGRSKETTVNEKTGRYNSKKRFGSSIQNNAPYQFMSIMDYKIKYWSNFEQELNKINTYKVKASQYNHIDDSYKKKELSERWNNFEYNNKKLEIQRDAYSAFLLKNLKNREEIDRNSCISEFDEFIALHDNFINNIAKSDFKNIM